MMTVTLVGWLLLGAFYYFSAAPVSLQTVSDFLVFWGAPHIAAHDISQLFSIDAYHAALKLLFRPDPAIDSLFWGYPLQALFFFQPFAALPYTLALTLWLALGLLAFFGTAHLAFQATRAHDLSLWWLAAAPITVIELLTFQNGFFVSAGALGVLLLMEHKRPLMAGMLLGCLTIKPHLFILWPLMLLVMREWRVLLGATLSTLGLLAASLAVHGVDAWQLCMQFALPFQWMQVSQTPANDPQSLFAMMMTSPLVALRLLQVPLSVAIVVQAVIALVVGAVAMRAFARPLSFAQRALILASGSLLVSPYGFNYDMPFFTVALLLYWQEHFPRGRVLRLCEAMVYLLPVAIYSIQMSGVPVTPLLIAIVFFRTAWGSASPMAVAPPRVGKIVPNAAEI